MPHLGTRDSAIISPVVEPWRAAPGDKEPFDRFMLKILEAYHDEGLQDGERLSAYANQLLSREPMPAFPPATSPSAFALARVRQVDESPGNNPKHGLQWLLDALVAWHDCAEAYMWTSNIIEGREHAPLLMQPFYILAIEALKHRLGPMPSIEIRTGADVPEARMMAKALTGLGESLATTGRVGDAVLRYVDALRWDPDDREQARPRLAIALAIQGEDESARAALAPATETAFRAYAALAIGYAHTEGHGEEMQALLGAAREANPDVLTILSGRRKMPGMLTGNQRFDEAQYICLMLGPALKGGMPGFAAWAKRAGGPAEPESRRRRRHR